MFSPASRYAQMATYSVVRADGTIVQAVKSPLPGSALVAGFHRRLAGQRLDSIAFEYLNDATAFWRLCDANDAMVPDALAVADLIGVPLARKAGG
jgi:hypothetical protein